MAELGLHHATFGIVSDLQWAAVEDALSFDGTRRYYKNSLELLRSAAREFEAADVDFAIHLGDIVDGKNRLAAREEGRDEIAAGELAVGLAADACGLFTKKFYHVIGNHCVYTLDRPRLYKLLGIKGRNGRGYYSFDPHPSWRCVVLDTFDLSILGWPRGSLEYAVSKDILHRKSIKDRDSDDDCDDSLGVENPLDRRWAKFGGGVGAEQLAWFLHELKTARQHGRQVLVFSHCVLHPNTAAPTTLMWNYEEVLSAVQSAGNVVATFAGHAHKQGYHQDSTGVHHNVIPALLESPPPSLCHGFVKLYEGGCELVGIGHMSSKRMASRAGLVATAD